MYLYTISYQYIITYVLDSWCTTFHNISMNTSISIRNTMAKLYSFRFIKSCSKVLELLLPQVLISHDSPEQMPACADDLVKDDVLTQIPVLNCTLFNVVLETYMIHPAYRDMTYSVLEYLPLNHFLCLVTTPISAQYQCPQKSHVTFEVECFINLEASLATPIIIRNYTYHCVQKRCAQRQYTQMTTDLWLLIM